MESHAKRKLFNKLTQRFKRLKQGETSKSTNITNELAFCEPSTSQAYTDESPSGSQGQSYDESYGPDVFPEPLFDQLDHCSDTDSSTLSQSSDEFNISINV